MDCHSYNTNATMSRCFLLHNIDVNLNVLLISYLLLYFNSTYLLKHGSNNQNSLLLSNRKVLSNEYLNVLLTHHSHFQVKEALELLIESKAIDRMIASFEVRYSGNNKMIKYSY